MKKNVIIKNISLGVGLLSIGLLFNIVKRYHSLTNRNVKREKLETSEDGIFYKTDTKNND